MPRATRIGALLLGIGLMLAGCMDPASLPNEIQALDDTVNTNMPPVQERASRAVGNIVLSAAPKPSATPTPTPQPTPSVRPTSAPTPSPSPSGPIILP